jgi:transcriptional regulator with XRE-family HTH domain
MQPRSEQPSFGSLLRRYRTGAGLTQEQLAERAGLSRRGIADLERGARQAPYAHTLDQLRAALGLSDADDALLLAAARAGRSSTQPSAPDLRRSLDGGVPEGAGRPEAGQLRDNLAIQTTSFVGRSKERAQLAVMIRSAPLVTLVGPGGVGKTRLGLQVAAETRELWPDGVWVVEFAPLIDPADTHLVLPSVAAILGIQQAPGVDLEASVITWLRSRSLLLVLDNCEHVLDACAQLVSQIAHACPDVHVLATSQEPLGIAGENVSRVDPLTVPDDACTPDLALESEAVQLFIDRERPWSSGSTLRPAHHRQS